MSDPARSDELARFDRQEIDAYQAATGAREVPEALAVIARRVAAASPLLVGLQIRLVGYHAAWPNARAAAHGDVMLADALWSGPFRLDEDEAAALLAHELAHVELRHALHMACSALAANPDPAEGLALSLRRLQVTVTRNQASPTGRALLAVMREREAEADRRGQALMLEAGYSPHGLVTLLVKMNGLQAQVQAATHGESAERAEAARQRLVAR